MNTTIFNLAGNKSKLFHRLQKYFPTNYDQYVELFGGTLSILQNVNFDDIPLDSIIVNDYNQNFYKLYMMIKKKSGVNFICKSIRKWYNYLKSHQFKHLYLEKFYKKYKAGHVEFLPILTRLLYYGITESKTGHLVWHTKITLTHNTVEKICNSIQQLHEKLNYTKSKIYNIDLTKDQSTILNNIKRNAFVFIDPPYLGLTNNNNKVYGEDGHDNGVYDWRNMLIKLHRKNIKFMLTDKYTSKTLQHYNKIKKDIRTLKIKKIKGRVYDEIMLINY